MNILAESPWKSNSNRITDPILCLSNQNKSQKPSLSSDRFLSNHSTLGTHHQKTNIQRPKYKFSQNINYEEALLNTCKSTSKNAKPYQSKIKRSGYLLTSDIFSSEQENYCEEKVRKIPSEPFKIVHAPKLKDDFYTNLLDWSTDDLISVVLDNAAYIWNSSKNETQKLIEGYISSVKWGKGLVLGEETGRMKVLDVQKKKEFIKWRQHQGRIGTLDIHGNQNLIVSGSKDKNLMIWDTRSRELIYKLEGHRQQICGVRWSPDGNYIASGGNDNTVCLWNTRMNKLETKFTQHCAAVKALAWSPHQNSILATGGGSTDKTIKLWNINENKCLRSIDTGSQVCTMAFCQNTNQIISTHGFSLNSINIWNAKNMTKLATLQGHTYRVLYMAKSPQQDTIVTGSGDQTLRFWKISSGMTRINQPSQLQAKNSFIR